MTSDPDGIDYAFVERLEALTARVGRMLLIGVPSLFLIGLLILPLNLTAAPALLIVVVGTAGVIALYEFLRADRPRTARAGRLSTPARVALIGTASFLVLYAVLLASTLQTQAP